MVNRAGKGERSSRYDRVRRTLHVSQITSLTTTNKNRSDNSSSNSNKIINDDENLDPAAMVEIRPLVREEAREKGEDYWIDEDAVR